MTRFILLALCLALPAYAQLPPQTDYKLSSAEVRRAILSVISEQLAHFRAGEPDKAYALAATRLKEQLPAERFAALVKRSYPEIWANSGAQFGVVRDDVISAIVVVQVVPKAGDPAAYDYFLLKENDAWRIGGVLRHEEKRPQA